MPVGLLAAAASASGLFSYNRENFFFDKQQQIKLEYQAQEMKIRQFELYREDVRDLVGLTIGKMENYLLINTLQLGFCFTLFAEGRPKPGTNQWLVCLFSLCNAGAFLYYLLSMWLAMHASISAHAFGVRLLTQFVRLPVPDGAALDRARALSSDFEGLRASDLLRVPVWKQQLRRLEAAMEDRAQEASEAGSDAGDSFVEATHPAMQSVAAMSHVRMFRKLQANWQSYDAYARVCMAMGTNQLLHTLSYCTLGLLVHQNNVPLPALSCVFIFTGGAFVLGKLDLYLSRHVLTVAATLLVTPPVLTMFSMIFLKSGQPMLVYAHKVMIIVVFVLHVCWIVFTVLVARADSFSGVSLPTKYRSVLFLDVFGWLAEEEDDEQDQTVAGSQETVGNGVTNPLPSAAGLAPVAENASFSMREEPEGGSLPQSVRPILLADCWELHDRLSQDLRRWESHEVSQLLLDSRMERKELRRLRRLFDAMTSELTQFTGTDQPAAATAPRDPTSESPVYLQLDWNPEGIAMSYYYQCEKGETLWEAPAGCARISDLESLARDVGELCNKIRALAKCAPPSTSSRPGSARQSRSGSSGSAPPSQGQRVQTEQPTGSEPAAQVTDAGTTDDHRRGPSSTPQAGRIPWRIVLRGSQALIAVWLLSTVISTLSLLGVIRYAYEKPMDVESQPLGQLHQVIHADSWPHPFPRPVGLACTPATGPVALVAEKYAIHEFHLESHEYLGRSTQMSLALEMCLSRAHAFRGRGLADVGLDCSDSKASGSCSAVILGADGQRALRCSLHSATAVAVTPLKLLGGPWRTLAPGHGGTSWVLGIDRIPTQLRSRGDSEDLMLPVLDLLEGAASSIVALHALGNHTLLSLEAHGRVHAWPLRGGPVRSWSLPVTGGVLWTGLCAAGNSLYLAGAEGGASGAAGIWRVALPHELQSALAQEPAVAPTLTFGSWQLFLR